MPTKLEKLEKIVVWGMLTVTTAFIGTVGVMNYLANRDAGKAKLDMKRELCYSLKTEARNIAEKNKDQTMLLILNHHWVCRHKNDYDRDLPYFLNDIDMLEMYIKHWKDTSEEIK